MDLVQDSIGASPPHHTYSLRIKPHLVDTDNRYSGMIKVSYKGDLVLLLQRGQPSLYNVSSLGTIAPPPFTVPGGQIVRVSSKNRPGYHWAIDEGVEGYLMTQPELFKGCR